VRGAALSPSAHFNARTPHSATRDAAARVLQAYWRLARELRRARKWQVVAADLRALEEEEEEASLSRVVEDEDDLESFAPPRSGRVDDVLNERVSARVSLRFARVSEEAAEALAAQRQRRRPRTPHLLAADREGDFLHPSNLTKAVLHDKTPQRVAYPGVVRSWKDATVRAKAVAAASMPRSTVAGGKPTPYSLKEPMDQLHLGAGISLYFGQVWSNLWLFFACAALVTPSIVFHLLAQRRFDVYSDRQSIFSQITLGTQQVSNMDVSSGGLVSTTDVRYAGYKKEVILLGISILDCAHVALFVGASSLMRARQRARQRVTAGSEPSLGRYSLIVWGLPLESATPELAAEVRRHFESLDPGRGGGCAGCAVADVALATTCAQMLRLFRGRGEALRARRAASALLSRSRGEEGEQAKAQAVKQLEACDARIQAEFAKRSLNTVAAFVTFEHADVAAHVARTYDSLRARILPPAQLRFRGDPDELLWPTSGHRLRVCPAPEPSNILWSHLEVGGLQRLLRRGAVNCVAVALMCATFGIVVAASNVSKELPPNVSQADSAAAGVLQCDALWPMGGAYSVQRQAARDGAMALARGGAGGKGVGADCGSFAGHGLFLGYGVGGSSTPPFSPLYGGAALTGNASTPAYQCAAQLCLQWTCESLGVGAYLRSTDGANALCSAYWLAEFKTTGFLVTSSAVIVAVNQLFRVLITSLAHFEKHHTLSAEEAAISIRFFVSSLINTALIYLIVYGAVQNYPGGLLDIRFLFGGKHFAFTRDWYSEVGSSIIRTMVLRCVLDPVVTWLLYGFGRLGRRLRKHRIATQELMDKRYQGPIFCLAERYGQHTAYLFTVFLFSSGLPVLVWFAAFYYGLSWLSDKLFLLRACRTPPAYDPALHESALGLVKWAALLHFAVGTWMFSEAGSTSLEGVVSSALGRVDASVLQNADLSSQFNLRQRALKTVAFPQFLGFLACCALVLLGSTVRATLGRLAAAYLSLWTTVCADPASDAAAKLPPLNEARYELEEEQVHEQVRGDVGGLPESKHGWSGATSYAMSHDERYRELFTDPSAGEGGAPGTRNRRAAAQAALERAALQGFVIFDPASVSAQDK